MFHYENYKIRAKSVKHDEGVSGTDTSRSAERFAAEFYNLQ